MGVAAAYVTSLSPKQSPFLYASLPKQWMKDDKMLDADKWGTVYAQTQPSVEVGCSCQTLKNTLINSSRPLHPESEQAFLMTQIFPCYYQFCQTNMASPSGFSLWLGWHTCTGSFFWRCEDHACLKVFLYLFYPSLLKRRHWIPNLAATALLEWQHQRIISVVLSYCWL